MFFEFDDDVLRFKGLYTVDIKGLNCLRLTLVCSKIKRSKQNNIQFQKTHA